MIFAVMLANAASLRLFIGLETQWRTLLGPKGLIWLGLDYSAVESLMRVNRVKDRARTMADLAEMERAVLPVLNGERPREGDNPWP